MIQTLSFYWFDVFARAPLSGNPLCVFSGTDAASLELMRKITRELGHSETTFLQQPTLSSADRRVRIFIPAQASASEIPFAGHPILGSACAVSLGRSGRSVVRLETGAGVIPVVVAPLGEGVWEVWMSQPLPHTVRTIERTVLLADALGLEEADLRADVPLEAVDNGMKTVLIPMASVEAVRRARPDLARLRTLLGRDGDCTLLFAMGGLLPDSDVHCRVFSPFDLVPEDPATGSANGPLGEYLVRHGLTAGPLVRSEQGLEMGRPGRLVVKVERSGDRTTAVHVGGQVRLVGKGELRL